MTDEHFSGDSRKKLWKSLAFYSILSALAIWFAVNFTSSYIIHNSLKRTHDSLLTSYSDLHRANMDMDSLMQALQYNDPEAIEWVARYQWHLARPGEKVYQLIPDAGSNNK